MISLRLWPLLPLLLAGCATVPPAPVIKTVRVEVPVPVPCINEPVTKPAFAVDALPIGSKVSTQMRALRAERKQRIGYETVMESELSRCMRVGNVN